MFLYKKVSHFWMRYIGKHVCSLLNFYRLAKLVGNIFILILYTKVCSLTPTLGECS